MSTLSLAQAQQQFVSHLPALDTTARHAFRRRRPQDREEKGSARSGRSRPGAGRRSGLIPRRNRNHPGPGSALGSSWGLLGHGRPRLDVR